jgi:hypothetical protein
MQETGFLSTELSALACVHNYFYSTNFSQVWLQVREKSRKIEEFCYILWQPNIKIQLFHNFLPLKSSSFCAFFAQKSFV